MPRFMQKGITRFFLVPTIADPLNISAAAVAAGEELTDEIAEINGFTFANSPIAVPDMGQAFVANIPGEDTADTSNIMFYENDDAGDNPHLDAQDKGTVAWMVIFPYGTASATPAAADVVDAWPVQVASKARGYSAGNEASKVNVVYTIRDEPTFDEALVA